MRIIKFRGKRVDNDEWVVGDLLQVANEVFIAPSDGDWFDFIPWSKDNVFHLPSSTYQSIPDTVGQFTGLLDKNGTEIYEGDVIRSDGYSGARHYVGYRKEEAMFVAFIIGTTPQDYCGVYQHWIDDFNKEVIGNIHDNPELMEQND